MKNYYFFVFLILFVGSCTLIQTNDDAIYSGDIKVILMEDDDTAAISSHYLRIKIDGNDFIRLDADGNEGCFGKVKWRNNSIEFKSEDCSCFCDCAENIDCGGDPILGKFDLTLEEEDKLEFNYKNSYEIDYLNDDVIYSSQYFVRLERE